MNLLEISFKAADSSGKLTVLPGARRIGAGGGPYKNAVAFRNRDGSKVPPIANDTGQIVFATLATGITPVRLDVPAQSMNTAILRQPRIG